VKVDVYNMLQSTPTLCPKESAFVNNDGKQVWMLLLEGTLPISYKSAVYHIPINLWVHPNYPFSPPICYVVPTPNMAIRPKHQHVDASGFCYHPYLNQWRADISNLVQLTYSLISTFSYNPPVFAKVEKGVTSPQPVSPPTKPVEPLPSPTSPQPISANNPVFIKTRPVVPTGLSTSPTTHQHLLSQSQISKPKDSNDPKKNAMTDKLMTLLQVGHKEVAEEVQNQIQLQQILEKSDQLLSETLTLFESDQELLTRNEKLITAKEKELDQFLTENENKKVEVDELVSPADVLSSQLFEVVAEDQAIEDVLYNINLGLIKGIMDCETYLKQVRLLSRDQFMARVLAKKVHAELQKGI